MDAPIYKIIINEEDEATGVKAVSFVNSPAIEEGFVALSKQAKLLSFAADEFKQVVTGPALIPDINIYRLNDKGEPYFITFGKDVIDQIAKKFFKQGLTLSTNQEHSDNFFSENVVFESWIIEDSEVDKAAKLGFNLPVGTWMLSVYIPDMEYYKEEILSGKRTGFSIEGSFLLEKNINNQKMNKTNLFEQVVNNLKKLIFGDEAGEPTAKKEEELGPALATLLQGGLDTWAAELEIDKAAAVARVVEATGLTAENVLNIVDGLTACPEPAEVSAIVEVLPNVTLEQALEAWAADGCTEETENKEDKKEEPKVEAPAELSDAEVVAKLNKDLVEAKRIAQEFKTEADKVKAEAAADKAKIEELSKQVEELSKLPAIEPIVDKPTTKKTTKKLSFAAKYVENFQALQANK